MGSSWLKKYNREMLSWIILYLISAVFLVPFSIGVLYFFMGIRTLVTGRREKSAVKIKSGYKSILLSLLVIILISLTWYTMVGKNS
jgi:hypothetical protein